MITVKLRDQVSSLVAKGKLIGVSGEHDLSDVHAEHLPLLRLTHTVEEDVVDGTFLAADNSFSAVFVEEHGLILHVNLLLQLQVALAKDQDFPLEGHVDISGRANSTEDFDSLTLTIDRGNETEIVRVEEVDLVGVLPDELVLVALQFVAPGED